MHLHDKPVQQLVAFVLLLSLLLQSCGNSLNQLTPQEKEQEIKEEKVKEKEGEAKEEVRGDSKLEFSVKVFQPKSLAQLALSKSVEFLSPIKFTELDEIFNRIVSPNGAQFPDELRDELRKVIKKEKGKEKEKEKGNDLNNYQLQDDAIMAEEEESDTELEAFETPYKPAGLNQPLPIIPEKEITIHDDKLLGRGGMGAVYQATYQGKIVAAKRLHCPSDEAGAAFKNEAKIMDNMRHENMIAFLGFCPQQHIVVMEYAPGGSLWNLLQRHKDDRNWDRYWKTRYQIALDVAKGMTYLHDYGILHRDLKSPNILLNEQRRAQITDFGISLLKSKHSTFEMRYLDGSYRWMSPELINTEQNTPAGDVYSYGMVLWELGARKIPFAKFTTDPQVSKYIAAGNREVISKDTPPEIRKIIELCWLPESPLKKGADTQVRPTMRQVRDLLKTSQTAFLKKEAGQQEQVSASKEPEKEQEVLVDHSQPSIKKFPRLHSSIQEVKLIYYLLPRKDKQQELSKKLKENEICVVYGPGGAGKSTLVAQYGRTRRDKQSVWWMPAETADKLITSYENLAQELGIHQEALIHLKKTATHYLQELARKVYTTLLDCDQPALLILDNAIDSNLIEDCFVDRPSLVEVIVTTRDKRSFGNYSQVELNAFTLEEGNAYVQQKLHQLNPGEGDIAVLISAVGLMPQKLALATSYINQISFMNVKKYITKLEALKKAGKKREGKLILPEVSLGLETLDIPSQLMMRYGACLDPDFIPLSLVMALLKISDEEELDTILASLERLSLITIIQDPGKEGIQIHREVQIACKAYQDWRTEIAEGAARLREQDLLVSLIEVLDQHMPDVTEMPDNTWDPARLYASNVTDVVANAITRGVVHPLLADLLHRMGKYNNHVCCNYQGALKYHEQALQIMRNALYTGNHPDIAASLDHIGIVYYRLGQHQEALKYHKQVLQMRKALYTGNHPGIAASFNNIGEVYRHLEKGPKALKYLEQALEMWQALHTGNHPNIAASFNNIGLVNQSLGQPQEALKYLKQALEMWQTLYTGNHPNIAMSFNNIGMVYSRLGQPQEALKYLKEALEMRQALYSGDHPDIAFSLNGIGEIYQGLGQHQEALKYHEQALEMWQTLYTGNHPDIAMSLNDIGVFYQRLGQHQEALKYLKEALEMRQVLYSDDHPYVARSLNNIGKVYSSLGQKQKALEYHKQVLEASKALYKGDHPDIVISLNDIGNIYRYLGQNEAALKYYEQALEMLQALYSGDHPDIAFSLNDIGEIYQGLGQHQEALKYFEQAFEMNQTLYQGNHPHVARSLNNIGMVHSSLGQHQEALKYLKQAHKMWQSLYQGNHPGIANSLNNIGYVYQDLGKNEETLRYLEQALEMYQALYQGNHPSIATSLNNIGSVYKNLEKHEAALKYLKQALEIWQTLYTGNHPNIATALNNVGSIYKALDKPQKALRYYKQALKMRQTLYTGNHPDIAFSLNGIGEIYQGLGQNQEALKYYQQALQMMRALYTGNHPDIANFLDNIGNVYADLGQNQEALKYYEQALQMRQALYTGNHPNIVASLNNIGNVYTDLGRNREALKYYQQALQMRKALYTDNHPDIELVKQDIARLEEKQQREKQRTDQDHKRCIVS